MNILVAGGAGYIGSHTCVSLLEAGHSVIIADNFSNSERTVVDKITKITGSKVEIYEVDVTNSSQVDDIFRKNHIDGVIHLAGYKAVGESVFKPLDYYNNNINSTLVLANACLKFGISRFVFSSSATVYGNNISPFVETMGLLPTTNPYGETKVMCERILRDISKSNQHFSVVILRYFNPVGAHKSGLIGEAPIGAPNNLMPYITQVAKGLYEKLLIFGDDYHTVDGTGIRDYIHVSDLADGHVAALEYVNENNIDIFNLGTGKGTSVLQLVHAFEVANNIKIPYQVVERRPGDIASCYADTTKAELVLGWKAKRNIVDMCRDAWNFEESLMLNHK